MDQRTRPQHNRPRRRHTHVARERPPLYDGDGTARSDTPEPFGLPVLAELPELAATLAALADADRLLVQGVLALSRLLERDADEVAAATGVGLEHWIALTGTSPRLERRTWLRAARLLCRLPRLRDQVEAGRVTAGQLRGLSIALRGTPAVIDDQLDTWLADAAGRLHELDADPDALIEQARHALTELTDQLDQLEDAANRERFLSLQPRLDGSGGTYSGSEDAYGFAILEAATRLRPGQPLTDAGRARADNLQVALHGIPPCHADHHTAPGDADPGGADADVVPTMEPVGSWAGAAVQDAAWQATHQHHRDQAPDLAERIAGYTEAGGYAPPKLLVRAELSTLLDGRIPIELLVGLTGGRLSMTAPAARALIDHHGTQLRLIITDHGHVVGIGRASRRSPGWLTDGLHAIHSTCTAPLCDRPALGADTDHAASWHPDGDQAIGGRTDADNTGPLCLGTNRHRAATGWHPVQHGSDGIRTWTHPRTGLTTTSIPATWRPPSRHPPPPEGRRQRSDPDDDLPF